MTPSRTLNRKGFIEFVRFEEQPAVRLPHLALFLFVLRFALVGLGATETVGDLPWTYTVSNGVATVGGGVPNLPAVPSGASGALVVPSTLGGRPVRRIGDYAFSSLGTNLTAITLPKGVTDIGEEAFAGCRGLTEVVVPPGVTNLAFGAFRDCSSLTKVTLPRKLVRLGGFAFQGCTALKSLMIPSGVNRIGWAAFFGCSNLKTITFNGNAPSTVGDGIYLETPRTLTTCVKTNSTGWANADAAELPSRWPVGDSDARAIRYRKPKQPSSKVAAKTGRPQADTKK